MSLFVNTIEFNGVKAVLNSYSRLYVSVYGMKDIDTQREEWADRFPNATVRTEELSESETIRLVAEGNARRPTGYRGHYSPSWEIGEASKK